MSDLEKQKKYEDSYRNMMNFILLPVFDREIIPQAIIDDLRRNCIKDIACHYNHVFYYLILNFLEKEYDFDSLMKLANWQYPDALMHLCNIGFKEGKAMKIHDKIVELKGFLLLLICYTVLTLAGKIYCKTDIMRSIVYVY